MSSASKVGEIFTAAGTAFTKLGELTMQLHTSNGGGGSTKWTEEDIAMMHTCLTKFANEIDEISNRVRLRTMTHINSTVKKKEYEDAGLPAPSPSLNSLVLSSQPPQGGSVKGNNRKGGKKTAPSASATAVSSTPPPHLPPPCSPPPHSQEVTLNMLNASDPDSYLKIDFDGSGSS